ncbi:MAG: hypothetical protein K0R38_1398 [Polyangiaceae bacterium]|jgi:integrase|nr:hypothetical protein [Polyangiaceae bacterium]
MTFPIRSLKSGGSGAAIWRDLSSPPAANDVALNRVSLSRRLPTDAEEIELLGATLDLASTSDLRAAALLVMVALGLHKRDIVHLNVADVLMVGAAVCVRVRGRRALGRETFLPIIGADARTLRTYLSEQHGEAPDGGAPLFYNIEHGRADRRKRITANAVSYWLLELRLRARQVLAGVAPG